MAEQQQRPPGAKPLQTRAAEETATDAVSSVGEDAQQKAQDIGNMARERARGMADDARRQAESGKDKAAEQVERTSEAVRKAAHELEGEQTWMADLVERGADELDRVARTLRENDLRSLLQQAQEVARRQPVLFAGGAFALGFAAMRAVRAGVSEAPQARAQIPKREDGATPRSGNGVYGNAPVTRPGDGQEQHTQGQPL